MSDDPGTRDSDPGTGRLRARLADLVCKTRDLDDRCRAMAQVRATLSRDGRELVRTLAELESEAEELERTIDAERTRLSQIDLEADELRGECAALRAKVRDADRELEALGRDEQRLVAQLDAGRAGLRGARSTIEGIVGSAQRMEYILEHQSGGSRHEKISSDG